MVQDEDEILRMICREHKMTSNDLRYALYLKHMPTTNRITQFSYKVATEFCEKFHQIDTKTILRETIWIRKTDNMNRDEGSYQLSHAWDKLLHTDDCYRKSVLIKTSDVKSKHQ